MAGLLHEAFMKWSILIPCFHVLLFHEYCKRCTIIVSGFEKSLCFWCLVLAMMCMMHWVKVAIETMQSQVWRQPDPILTKSINRKKIKWDQHGLVLLNFNCNKLLFWYTLSFNVILTARIAQSVERETFNLKVVGSTPTSGAFFLFLFNVLTWQS